MDETARSSMALPVRPKFSEPLRCSGWSSPKAEASYDNATQIEAQVEASLAGDADAVRLRQLPGIGPIIALTILAKTGDLCRFGHHRQFLEVFVASTLRTHQSGMFCGRRPGC